MKVIGITEIGEGYHKQDAYVAIVSRAELLKLSDKARFNQEDSVPELKVGNEFDLGAGYDFRNELIEAIRKMAEAYTAFAKVAPVAAEFAGVVQRKSSGGT